MFHFVNCTLRFFFFFFFFYLSYIHYSAFLRRLQRIALMRSLQTNRNRTRGKPQAGSLSVSPTQTFHGHFRYTVGSGYEIGLVRRSVRCRALETNLSVKAPDFNYIFIPGTLLTPNSIDLCLIFPAECMKENSLLPFHPFRVAPWLLIKKGI